MLGGGVNQRTAEDLLAAQHVDQFVLHEHADDVAVVHTADVLDVAVDDGLVVGDDDQGFQAVLAQVRRNWGGSGAYVKKGSVDFVAQGRDCKGGLPWRFIQGLPVAQMPVGTKTERQDDHSSCLWVFIEGSALIDIQRLFLRLTPANPTSPVAINSMMAEPGMEFDDAFSVAGGLSVATATAPDSEWETS